MDFTNIRQISIIGNSIFPNFCDLYMEMRFPDIVIIV